MAKPHLIANPRLSSITLFLDMQGEAWGGFMAERETRTIYAPKDWPGLRRAIADACEWGDVRAATVQPFYGQLHHTLTNGHGHTQHIVREIRL